jgi:quinol monooxygenase YgiN
LAGERPYRLPPHPEHNQDYPPSANKEAVDVSVYTVGIWLVHPGRENDFVQAWRDLARRTQEDFPHARAVLMHDQDVPNRFISTGPWESIEQIGQWRASATFRQGLESMKDMVEHFEPHTLDEAATVGGDTA